MDLNLPEKVFISNRFKWRKLIPTPSLGRELPVGPWESFKIHLLQLEKQKIRAQLMTKKAQSGCGLKSISTNKIQKVKLVWQSALEIEEPRGALH